MSVLWRGSFETRLRIATGLILFTFAFFHFINLSLGLFSPVALDSFQDARQVITRSRVGSWVMAAALLTHAGLALVKLARRRTLKMPFWEATQITLGLTIPILLAPHFVHTRLAHELFDTNDRMSFSMLLLWDSKDGWLQSLLLLVVWTHGCIGLHFWLRMTHWWRQAFPWLVGIAALIPALGLAGFMIEGRRMHQEMSDPETRALFFEWFNFPDQAAFDRLAELTVDLRLIILGLLLLTGVVYLGRKIFAGRQAVRIRYVDGPEIASPVGPTLLEMARANGVPHTSLCGGRGRCTTCRVVFETGAEALPPPTPAEQRSLAAVNAPPNARLACQVRPARQARVFRVFRPEGGRDRAHASQGKERRLAILFLDMRGFTARTTGQLPYDVVFLLNRFFDAIVPSIKGAGGTVDKYLGDGLLAVFEQADAQASAQAALKAAAGVGSALDTFNKTLKAEDAQPVRIGIGVHLGDLVLGEIGAAGNAPRTIIGDTVNAASRLEGKTKDLGVELLLSEDLLTAAGHNTDPTALIPLDLRGVDGPFRALPVSRAAGVFSVLEGLEQHSDKSDGKAQNDDAARIPPLPLS